MIYERIPHEIYPSNPQNPTDTPAHLTIIAATTMHSLFSLLSWLPIVSLTQAAGLIAQPQTNLTLPIFTNLTSVSGLSVVSFKETVYNAVVHTLARYPRALLLEVEAVSIAGATTDPSLLRDVRLIFAIPDRAPDTTLIVDMSNTWGRWKRPRLSPLPVPRQENVMPGWLDMDIFEADANKIGAGYRGPYWSVIVAWPMGLPAERDQPMYMFQMEDEAPGNPKVVYVGARNGRVTALYDAKQMDPPDSRRLVSTS